MGNVSSLVKAVVAFEVVLVLTTGALLVEVVMAFDVEKDVLMLGVDVFRVEETLEVEEELFKGKDEIFLLEDTAFWQ